MTPRRYIVLLVSAGLGGWIAGVSAGADGRAAESSMASGSTQVDDGKIGRRMAEAGSNEKDGEEALDEKGDDDDKADQNQAAGFLASWATPNEFEEELRKSIPKRVFFSSPVFFLFFAAVVKPPITLAAMGLPDTTSYQALESKPDFSAFAFLKANGFPAVLVLLAMYATLTDILILVGLAQSGLPASEVAGIACITLASTGNIGSYLSALLVYCMHSNKVDGEDGKMYLFGEPPCCDSLALIAMLFGKPEWFTADTLANMQPANRVLLIYLHVVYLPIIRILSLLPFAAGIVYFWFAVPVCALAMAVTMGVNFLMERLVKCKLGDKGKELVPGGAGGLTVENKMLNTIRWNLILPVIMIPLLPLLVSIGVRFALGEGYIPAVMNTVLYPTVAEFVQKNTESVTEPVSSVTVLA